VNISDTQSTVSNYGYIINSEKTQSQVKITIQDWTPVNQPLKTTLKKWSAQNPPRRKTWTHTQPNGL